MVLGFLRDSTGFDVTVAVAASMDAAAVTSSSALINTFETGISLDSAFSRPLFTPRVLFPRFLTLRDMFLSTFPPVPQSTWTSPSFLAAFIFPSGFVVHPTWGSPPIPLTRTEQVNPGTCAYPHATHVFLHVDSNNWIFDLEALTDRVEERWAETGGEERKSVFDAV